MTRPRNRSRRGAVLDGAQLTDCFEGLDRCIEAYRAAAASFSGSTVARITGLGSPRLRS